MRRGVGVGTGSVGVAVRGLVGRVLSVVAAVAVGLVWCSSAAALPGPPLQTPVATLAAAVSCSPDLASSTKPPVLLVEGTFNETPQQDFGWNFMQVLPRAGYPVCTVALPGRSLGDMQTTVEYVVYAIREIAQRSGRKVSVIGQQSGSVPANLRAAGMARPRAQGPSFHRF